MCRRRDPVRGALYEAAFLDLASTRLGELHRDLELAEHPVRGTPPRMGWNYALVQVKLSTSYP